MEPKFGTGHTFVENTVSTSTQCLVEALGLGSGHHPRKKLSGSLTTSLLSRAAYILGLELSLSHTPV